MARRKGWRFEPTRHGLAARGIKTRQRRIGEREFRGWSEKRVGLAEKRPKINYYKLFDLPFGKFRRRLKQLTDREKTFALASAHGIISASRRHVEELHKSMRS